VQNRAFLHVINQMKVEIFLICVCHFVKQVT